MNRDYPFKLLSCDTHLEHWPSVLKDYVPEDLHYAFDSGPVKVNLWGQMPGFSPDGVLFNVMSGYGKFSEVRQGTIDIRTQDVPGAYGGPKEYVEWLDIDGVSLAVILPGIALGAAIGEVRGTQDREKYLTFLRGYNNYLSDFCSAYPDRLIGGACIPTTGIDDAIEELRRVSKLPGIKTVAPGAYPNGTSCPSPDDDRFWKACLDLNMPLTLHGGISSPAAGLHSQADVAAWVIGHTEVATGGPYSAAQLIMTGVFDRLPDLRFIVLEAGAGWLPFMMDTMNHMYARHRYWAGINLKNPASWYCTSGNFLWNIISDHTAIELRHKIGVDNLSWASDFPHSNSEYPWSSVRALELTQNLSSEERYKILWGNAAKFYGIES